MVSRASLGIHIVQHVLLRLRVPRCLCTILSFGGLNAYCLIFMTDAHGLPGEVAYKTEAILHTSTPHWDEVFLFGINPRTVHLTLTLFDEDCISARLISEKEDRRVERLDVHHIANHDRLNK